MRSCRAAVVLSALTVVAVAASPVDARPDRGVGRQADLTGTIAVGGDSLTVTIPTADDNARISFEGVAGQRVSLNVTNVSIWFSYVSLLKPDGSNLTGYEAVFSSGKFVEPVLLPVSGTYTILIDPYSTATGSMTLTLRDVPADVSGTLAFGQPETVTIAAGGQNARLTFSGSAGSRVFVKARGVSLSPLYSAEVVDLIDPGNSRIGGTGAISSSGDIDTKTLTSSGTYAVTVDPGGNATGPTTLTVYDVPPDTGGSLPINGPETVVAPSVPGQNAELSFSGAAGQRVRLTWDDVSISSSVVKVLNPDGSVLSSSGLVGTPPNSLNVQLAATGQHRVVVDPFSDATGGMRLALRDPGNVSQPTINGIATNGDTLTINPGTWHGTGSLTSTYQWQSCDSSNVCTDILGATAETYDVTESEVGERLRVRVTETGSTGSTTVFSVPSAPSTGPTTGRTLAQQPPTANHGYRFLRQGFCCGGDAFYGTRAVIKSPGRNFSIPDEHAALMRVVAEGTYTNNEEIFIESLIQVGYGQTNGIHLDTDPACTSAQLTTFAEVAWNTTLTNGDVYECQFFAPAIGSQPVYRRFSVVNLESTPANDDWAAYIDDTRVFNLNDSMQTASLIYAGGEFTRAQECGFFNCPRVETGCAAGGYGLDTSLPWQRATSQYFRTAHTIQSSFIRNDFKHDPRWFVGDVPDGFWIQNKPC